MTKVTISRYWNNPKITTVVSNDDISITMDIEDFISALTIEMDDYAEDFINKIKSGIGPIMWTFKQDTLNKQIDNAVNKKYFSDGIPKAVDSILKKVKQETVKVR